MMLDRLLDSAPDGIVSRIQIRAIRWTDVWLNELHLLTIVTIRYDRGV